MFGNRRGVVELPADGPVTMGGGDLAYGGFWARFAALIIDNAILTIVAIALNAPDESWYIGTAPAHAEGVAR